MCHCGYESTREGEEELTTASCGIGQADDRRCGKVIYATGGEEDDREAPSPKRVLEVADRLDLDRAHEGLEVELRVRGGKLAKAIKREAGDG